jgi:beta-glucanase (GH16 family)
MVRWGIGNLCLPLKLKRTSMRVQVWSLLVMIALLAIVVTVARAEAPTPRSPVGAGYRLAWSDEFDGGRLDETKWQHRIDTRFWSAQLARNVSVADGCLRIALRKEKQGESDYTAGGAISPAFVGTRAVHSEFDAEGGLDAVDS